MERKPRAGEFYLHFKNKIYQVITVAEHSETGEQMVVYQALYGGFRTYVTTMERFVGEVDRAKYPQASQTYRFERVEPSELELKSGQARSDAAASGGSGEDRDIRMDRRPVAAQGNVEEPLEDNGEERPNAKLMEFLDADTFEKKYDILASMRDEITDKLIDNMAVVMDVVIPEGELHKRYEELKTVVRTRQRYELSNRLF